MQGGREAMRQLGEPMIKYKTGSWRDLIVEVEVERETDKFVVIEGRREVKRSPYGGFFDTWEDAYSYIELLARNRIEHCQKALIEAQEKLAKIEGLTKP
jgi:hypothetical protein